MFRIALTVVLGIVALWLAVAYCLPVLLPFGIGLFVARLAYPLAGRLQNGLHMPRWIATFLCVSGVFAILVTAVWLLVRSMFTQLGALAQELPSIFASLSEPLARLEQWLLQLCGKAPGKLGAALQQWLESLLQRGSMLGERLSAMALSFMGGVVTGLPDVLLFTVTAVLSSFMLCARLPELRRWLRNKLPIRWRKQLKELSQQFKTVLNGWCKAQLKLLAVTFAIVTIGLFLMHLPYAILLGAVIAIIDALPVLGAGTILLPWGAIVLLQGNTQRGLALVFLYAITALTRTALEPRLLGRQLGLPPLLTLIALYGGFRLCGVAGMLLFPIGAILLRQCYELVETAFQSHPQI